MHARLVQLLRYAVLAPSRHNTQPWLFEIEGPELRVFGDWRRVLPVADPQGRALVMACGAAVHNVEVAARSFGIAASVENLAGSGSRKDGLIARVRLEEAWRPTAEDRRLFAAIPLRRTNRFGCDGRPVPPGLVARLVRASARLDVRVRPVEETLRTAAAEIVREGDRQLWSTARYRTEVAAWSRTNDSRSQDGMPGYAHGLSDSASVLHRIWVRARRAGAAEEQRDRLHVLHSPALLSVHTAGDRAADWFTAGRAIQCVLLHAAAEGLSASFFSQAIEVPSARARLAEALGERGWPQLLVRIGYGRASRAIPRRPVSDVLRSVTAEPPRHAIVRAAVQGELRT